MLHATDPWPLCSRSACTMCIRSASPCSNTALLVPKALACLPSFTSTSCSHFSTLAIRSKTSPTLYSAVQQVGRFLSLSLFHCLSSSGSCHFLCSHLWALFSTVGCLHCTHGAWQYRVPQRQKGTDSWTEYHYYITQWSGQLPTTQ